MTWKEWLNEQVLKSSMESVFKTSLDSASPWAVIKGVLQRLDGLFFKVFAVMVVLKGKRSYIQPLIEENGDGIVALVTDGEGNFLIATKADPGNNKDLGFILLAPTLQASQDSLEKHPRKDVFTMVTKETKAMICQDGNRFLNKKTCFSILVVYPNNITPREEERWFTLSELKEAIRGGYANEKLVQAFALVMAA